MFFILLLSIVNLTALEQIQLKYEVTLSVLGRIGEAELNVSRSDNRYEVNFLQKQAVWLR